MNITEKFGIKSFEPWYGDIKNLINSNKQGNEASIYRQLKMADYMQDLEQQNAELLEALIEQTKDSINMYINHYGASKTTKEIETMHTDVITIIEKACHPKKWEQIKALRKQL